MSAIIEKIMSVRELAETAARSGSIDSRYTSSVRAAEGTRLHRLLQKNDDSGGEYETEVTLRADYERGGVRFVLSGRADGVIHMPDGEVTIDEIKTTMRSVAGIEEDDYPPHWAQAICYARMYSEQEGLGKIGVRLTYYQADTGEIKRFYRQYTAQEAIDYVDALLDKCVYSAVWEHEWKMSSRVTMAALEFPFDEFRPGQRRFAGEVYRAARDGTHLFAAAPTGTGKTISALFPAVKALGEGHCEKAFYLTAKETARSVATDAVCTMLTAGMRAKAVVITAKDKICPLEERRCDPEYCRFADGHFDRVDTAVMDAMEHGADFLGREEILAAAARHNVCPFELSLDISSFSDIVICDYNYVFDPRASLKRFFSEGGEYLILADEAHNLPARARDMYSTELSKSAILKAKNAAPKGTQSTAKKLRGALNKLNKTLLDLGREVNPDGKYKGERVSSERPEGIDKAISKLISASEAYLAEERDIPPELLEAYWLALDYMRGAERMASAEGVHAEEPDGSLREAKSNYAVITRVEGTEVTVRLFCADPAEYLSATLDLVRAAVFFSATLSPADYYATLLGGGEDAKKLALPSPFPRENFLPVVADFISTRYRDRERSLDAVAELIYTCSDAREGNYIAFFPSYAYMGDVFERFAQMFPEVRTARQERGMDAASRDAFLREFETGESLVGFAVMGGVFAEGVDFAGERAVGVIIVGTGLPGIDAESEILREYCDEAYSKGYDYAYIYPGMNRVLQSAGRVIRSKDDRGVALLIDDRFSKMPYPTLFPEHWSHRRRVRSVAELRGVLADFWGSR